MSKKSNSAATRKAKDIPLTEKWLFDFGFESGIYTWAFKHPDIKHGMLIFNHKSASNMFKLHELEIPIKYVHQLQNLYFVLTKKELKLK